MTFDTFIAEIMNRTPPDRASTSPEVIACWYVAWDEAEQMHELTTRDLAELIQGGLDPIDAKYVREWCARNDGEDCIKDDAEVLAKLDTFFA